MFGIDALGLGHPKFKADVLINNVPKDFAIGAFADDTFGSIDDDLKALIQAGFKTFRLHAHWADDHSPAPLDKIKNFATKYEAIAKNNLDIKFYLTYGCESKIPDEHQSVARITVLKTFAPSCTPVHCLMQSPIPGGDIVEEHGDVGAKPGHIVSYDGNSAFDCNNEHWNNANSNALIKFVWCPRMNLRSAHTTEPPKARSAAPDSHYVKAMIRLFEPLGQAPTPSFNGHIHPLNDHNFYKLAAEDMPPDGRSNKPLFLGQTKSANFYMVDINGKKVATLCYFADYPPDMHRYYSGFGSGSGLWGYEIADKALAQSGSKFIWFTTDNKNFWGPCDPSRRMGKF